VPECSLPSGASDVVTSLAAAAEVVFLSLCHTVTIIATTAHGTF